MSTTIPIKNSNGKALSIILNILLSLNLLLISFLGTFLFKHTQLDGHPVALSYHKSTADAIKEIRQDLKEIKNSIRELELGIANKNYITNRDLDTLEKELRRYIDGKAGR